MQRRIFLQLSAYTAAALTFPLATGCTKKDIEIEAKPFFFSHLAGMKAIMQTGEAYRKANKTEDDKTRLKALLLQESTLPSSAGDNAIQTMLIKKVDDDFKVGKIAVVNGWVLSLTEARQCALFSIEQS